MNNPETPTRPKKHRFWKIANKLLNITLVLMGLLWIANWYFTPKPSELQAQAKIEFEKANIMFSKQTVDEQPLD